MLLNLRGEDRTALARLLEGRHPLPVDVVADTVFQIRDCPLAVLRQVLRSHSVPTRTVAVELLGRFQAVSATDELTDLMRHDVSIEVRARAALAQDSGSADYVGRIARQALEATKPLLRTAALP